MDAIHEVFACWDDSCDGGLTYQALCKRCPNVDHRTIGSWFLRHDVNHDAVLDKDEFGSLMRKYYQSAAFKVAADGRQNDACPLSPQAA